MGSVIQDAVSNISEVACQQKLKGLNLENPFVNKGPCLQLLWGGGVAQGHQGTQGPRGVKTISFKTFFKTLQKKKIQKVPIKQNVLRLAYKKNRSITYTERKT